MENTQGCKNLPKIRNLVVSGCNSGLWFAILIATLVTTWSSPLLQNVLGLQNCNQNPFRNPDRNHRKKTRVANFEKPWTFRLQFKVVIRNPDRNPETFWNRGCDQGSESIPGLRIPKDNLNQSKFLTNSQCIFITSISPFSNPIFCLQKSKLFSLKKATLTPKIRKILMC